MNKPGLIRPENEAIRILLEILRKSGQRKVKVQVRDTEGLKSDRERIRKEMTSVYVSFSGSVSLAELLSQHRTLHDEKWRQQKRKCIFPFGLEMKSPSNGKFDLSQTTNLFETQLKLH